jgi:hypothetical protein
MANPTRKMIEVYEMLKDGKPFKFDTLVSRLGCKPVTAQTLRRSATVVRLSPINSIMPQRLRARWLVRPRQ